MASEGREGSLQIMRTFVHYLRNASNGYVDTARMAIRNDRQYEAVKRSVRKREAASTEEALKVLQDLGIVDNGVTIEDVRGMR